MNPSAVDETQPPSAALLSRVLAENGFTDTRRKFNPTVGPCTWMNITENRLDRMEVKQAVSNSLLRSTIHSS